MWLYDYIKNKIFNTNHEEHVHEVIKQMLQSVLYSVELYEGDHQKAIGWFYRDNPGFFNSSPYMYILSGKGETVLKHQRDLLGID